MSHKDDTKKVESSKFAAGAGRPHLPAKTQVDTIHTFYPPPRPPAPRPTKKRVGPNYRTPHYTAMGAQHSTRSTTACETSPSRGGESSSFEPGGVVDPRLTSKNAFSPIVPPAPLPQLMRPETFEEKLYRKVRRSCQGICICALRKMMRVV